jgi:hypothetical protein
VRSIVASIPGRALHLANWHVRFDRPVALVINLKDREGSTSKCRTSCSRSPTLTQANDLAEILSASKSSLTALPQGYIGLTRL